MDPEEYAEFMRQLEAEVFEELRKQGRVQGLGLRA
jgi:hypothetical protein